MHIVDACASCLHVHSRFAPSDARTRSKKNRSKSPEKAEKASRIPFKIAALSLMRAAMKPVRIPDLSSLRKQVLLMYA